MVCSMIKCSNAPLANNTAMATICAVVFHLASVVTFNVPAVSPRNSRRPETNTSRNMIAVAGSKIHGFIPEKPVITSKAITTIALSAIGSSIAPKRLSCFHARARYPSMKSVTAAPTNKINANQSAQGRVKYRNITATIGAARSRRIVRILGKFSVMANQYNVVWGLTTLSSVFVEKVIDRLRHVGRNPLHRREVGKVRARHRLG